MQRYTKKTIRKFLFHFSSFFIPPNLNYPSLLPFPIIIPIPVLHSSTFHPVLAALFSSFFPRPKSIAPLLFFPTSIAFFPDLRCFSPRPPFFCSPTTFSLHPNHYLSPSELSQLNPFSNPHIQSHLSVSYRSRWPFRCVLFSRFLAFQFQLPSAAPFLRSSFAVASLSIHPLLTPALLEIHPKA